MKKNIKRKPTIYAFIDSQNLNLGVRSQGWQLDWRKFRQYLRNKYNVSQAYLFIGQVAGNESLYTFLQKAGFLLIFKIAHHTIKTGTKFFTLVNVRQIHLVWTLNTSPLRNRPIRIT